MTSGTRTDKTVVRRALAVAAGALLLAGCSSSSSSAPTSTTIGHATKIYAKRYCEVLLVDPAAEAGRPPRSTTPIR